MSQTSILGPIRRCLKAANKINLIKMRTKLILVLIFGIMLTASFVYANGAHDGGVEEDLSIRHQFEDILPFHHFAESHIFAGIVLIVLWVSFFYLVYTLTQLLINKKH